MVRLFRLLFVVSCFACFFSNCVSTNYTVVENDRGILGTVENLDCCDDFKQATMWLDPYKEVVILVHGCKSSTGHFSTLKDVFESRGQQAICFSYNYRDSIEDCSAQLLTAINSIIDLVNPPLITVVGHSQGGLVARRALISNRLDSLALEDTITTIRLVTISTPFNGIAASSHCGMPIFHVLSSGITVLICQAVAGSTWSEINPSSDFIIDPGKMSDKVFQHLKINTDEKGTCRNFDINGRCIEDDYVFGLNEQYTNAVDADKRVVNIELAAGHAQVVGKPGQPPFELIHQLEKSKVLREQTFLSSLDDAALLAQLYRYY